MIFTISTVTGYPISLAVWSGTALLRTPTSLAPQVNRTADFLKAQI